MLNNRSAFLWNFPNFHTAKSSKYEKLHFLEQQSIAKLIMLKFEKGFPAVGRAESVEKGDERPGN